jgi:hypothetical protein
VNKASTRTHFWVSDKMPNKMGTTMRVLAAMALFSEVSAVSVVEFASIPLEAAAVATFVNAGSLGNHIACHHVIT